MEKKYRVVFCGTPEIAATILKTLLTIKDIEIVGVISQPERPFGRKKELKAPPVKVVALENNLQIFQPEKIETIKDDVAMLKPDFMVTCAYGQFVPDSILNLFKNAINIHASLLPKYRGGSPIQFAIMNGEEKTGISLMKMIKKMDAGEVYVQNAIEIATNDNVGSLFLKMGELGSKMIDKYLLDIFSKKIKGTPQNEDDVTFALNMIGEAEKINWTKKAIEINNFVRAMTPNPTPYYIF